MHFYELLPPWLQQLVPIFILLSVISIVVLRMPKVAGVQHTDAFKTRRFLNWFPAGMTYALLYFARYNLTAYKNSVGMTNEAYGTIDEWGALVYGVSFIVNGPLADRIGGRATLLLAAGGAAAANLGMGYFGYNGFDPSKTTTFALLYAGNMYFQSFGAVSIVKVNSAWFHLRERGTFGGIFGILISLGLYFAYDLGPKIAQAFPQRPAWVFFIPPMALAVAFVADLILVKDTPGQAGQKDFDTGDATIEDNGKKPSLAFVAKSMLLNRTILLIAVVEFCSGFLRNGIQKWFQVFSKGMGVDKGFVNANWGMLLCCAGIFGGMVAGLISDHVFGSRRGPVSTILYGVMTACTVAMYFTIDTPILGWVVVVMMLAVIGVHGMLSGTASMDFGGKQNVGLVVGLIDGFVYLGTAAQAAFLKGFLPDKQYQSNAELWRAWPIALFPVAVVGTLLATRVWNARPAKRVAH